jgi:hypothetical protein
MNIFVLNENGANNPLPISENEMLLIRAKDIYVLSILSLTRDAPTVENWSTMFTSYDIFVTRIAA